MPYSAHRSSVVDLEIDKKPPAASLYRHHDIPCISLCGRGRGHAGVAQVVDARPVLCSRADVHAGALWNVVVHHVHEASVGSPLVVRTAHPIRAHHTLICSCAKHQATELTRSQCAVSIETGRSTRQAWGHKLFRVLSYQHVFKGPAGNGPSIWNSIQDPQPRVEQVCSSGPRGQVSGLSDAHTRRAVGFWVGKT